MNRQQKTKASKGTLSEKFSKIAAQNVSAGARQTRKIVVVSGQANRRAAQANARRGISVVSRQSTRRSMTPKKPLVKSQSRRGRGRGRGGKGSNANGKGNNENKASVKSQTDLDLEMDSYWFAAGKGPNPVVAALDKDMDNYFKDRASKAEEPAADNKA